MSADDKELSDSLKHNQGEIFPAQPFVAREIWASVPSPKWSSKAESTHNCPHCSQPIQLYRTQDGKFYLKVASTWAVGNSVFVQTTPIEESDNERCLRQIEANVENILLGYAKKIDDLEKRIQALEDIPASTDNGVSTLGQIGSESSWAKAKETMSTPLRGECVQHPPDYIRFDDALHLYQRLNKHLQLEGSDKILLETTERLLHELPKTRLATP